MSLNSYGFAFDLNISYELYYMSAHHGIGLHPYVTPLSFVNLYQYPDIFDDRPQSEEACAPVVDSNGNIYGVEVHDNDLRLMRYKQQDYHENHFVSAPALKYHREVIQFESADLVTTNTGIPFDVSAYDIGSLLRVKIENTGLYSLSYSCEGNTGTVLTDTETSFDAITSSTTLTVTVVNLGINMSYIITVYAPPINQEVIINRSHFNYAPSTYTHHITTPIFDIDGVRYAATFPLITPNILSGRFTITSNKDLSIAPLNLIDINTANITTVHESVEAGLFETSGTSIISGTNVVSYDIPDNVFMLVYAYDPTGPALILTIGIEIVHYNPFLPILKCVNDVLYLYHHADYSHVVSFSIENNFGADLVERWSSTFGIQASVGILTNRYSIDNNGLMLGGSYIFPYYYLTSNSSAYIYRITDADGSSTVQNTYVLPQSTNVSMALSYPSLYLVYKANALYATYTADITTPPANLTINQMITTNALVPQLIPHGDAVTLFYGFNPNVDNIIQFANLFILNDETTGDPLGLGLPVFYNINRSTMYNEPDIFIQDNFHYSYTVNPTNDDYIYLAYITTTAEIRVVKLFRNELTVPTLFEQYKYMILWSTKVGAFQGFSYSGTGLGLHIIVDTTGKIYVFARQAESIYIWKINEFRLNLGHTFDTAITASANVISDFLNSITTKYDIRTLDPLLIYDLPEIRDVIISSVVDDGSNKRITLRYLNYDYFIGNTDARTELITGFQEAFEQLYVGTAYQVPSDGVVLEGDEEHVILVFSIPSARNNPCVLRGTEIVVSDGYNSSFAPIETINNGSFVINHKGKMVRVKKHTAESLITHDITRPYLIPPHFFGHNRPYKTLAISGDHAILHSGKRLYPKDILGIKRLSDGIYIEYHHIEMENPAKNFFLANGLEVESLYFGTRFDPISSIDKQIFSTPGKQKAGKVRDTEVSKPKHLTKD